MSQRSQYVTKRYRRRARRRAAALCAHVLDYLYSQLSEEENPENRSDLSLAWKTVASAFTSSSVSPSAASPISKLSARVLDRIWNWISRERDPWLKDDLRISWHTVRLASQGSPIPHIEGTYRILCCHPDKVWPRIQAMRKAKLGKDYWRFYRADGQQLPFHVLDIPDYDPTSELAPPLRGLVYKVSDAHWPAEQDAALPHVTPWPKAPLRRVVSMSKVWSDGRTLYHREELECGHSHAEFLGANPGNKRRRCHECSIGAAPKKRATEARHANVVKATPLRRSKTSDGTVYEMPSPPPSTKQESLRILPAEATG